MFAPVDPLAPGAPATASEKPPTNAAILARLASNAMAVLNFLAGINAHPSIRYLERTGWRSRSLLSPNHGHWKKSFTRRVDSPGGSARMGNPALTPTTHLPII